MTGKGIIKGMLVTAKNAIRSYFDKERMTTVQYPEEREEIERRQSRTMTEVLRGLPGIDVASNGGRGHTTSVYLRGTRPDRFLQTLDFYQKNSIINLQCLL